MAEPTFIELEDGTLISASAVYALTPDGGVKVRELGPERDGIVHHVWERGKAADPERARRKLLGEEDGDEF